FIILVFFGKKFHLFVCFDVMFDSECVVSLCFLMINIDISYCSGYDMPLSVQFGNAYMAD
ncbi:hypothetical protein, partial [Neisseria dentiae]|uniref:hypothetical protein n=1 Tax=Neisseria dentiae TaxID=194197 RepID=UPI0035A062DD